MVSLTRRLVRTSMRRTDSSNSAIVMTAGDENPEQTDIPRSGCGGRGCWMDVRSVPPHPCPLPWGEGEPLPVLRASRMLPAVGRAEGAAPSPLGLSLAHIYLCSCIIILLYHSHLCIL